MNIKWLSIASGILLILAIPPFWPYGYYVFLRWAIFISSIVIANGFYKSGLKAWVFIFGALAFLFNPIVPIYLNKSSWVAIDLVAAILFFLSAHSAKPGAETNR